MLSVALICKIDLRLQIYKFICKLVFKNPFECLFHEFIFRQMIKNDKSSVNEIKIQNISNNVPMLSNEIAAEINNYLSTNCIDEEELKRLISKAKVQEQQEFSRDDKELIIQALLNSQEVVNQHTIVSKADIETLPAMTYQVSQNAYAVGRNYKAHNYSTMSIIHILPSIGIITQDVFEKNKTINQYIFYGMVQLTPECFPVTQLMKSVTFNFVNMQPQALADFVEMNRSVQVFNFPVSNIKIITAPGTSNWLINELNRIFNVASSD